MKEVSVQYLIDNMFYGNNNNKNSDAMRIIKFFSRYSKK